MLLFTTEQVGYCGADTHHLITPMLSLGGSLRWSGCLHGCECGLLAGSAPCESSVMWEKKSSCQDTTCLFGIQSACKMRWVLHSVLHTTECSERDKMQVCKKGNRHGIRVWKNILLSTSWWKYAGWGCSKLRTSAEGVPRLPEENAERVHRPEFSPALSQIGCSQDDFGGSRTQWLADHRNVTRQFSYLFYTLYRSCL